MYGGIFTERPFEFNLKCIVISLFLAVAYWVSPKQNMVVLILILFASYFAISIYDHLYNCEARMKSGQYSPRSIFKPQHRIPDSRVPPAEYTYLRAVYLFHLVIAAPLIIYCGYKGRLMAKEHKEWQLPFSGLLSAGILATLYHSTRLVFPRQVTSTNANNPT
jgi:hypothetical protein